MDDFKVEWGIGKTCSLTVEMRRLGAAGLDADKTAVILPIQISAWFGRQVVAETPLQKVSPLFSFCLYSMLNSKQH